MSTICKQCRQAFEITKDDLAFYEKISPVFGGKKYGIPPPTLCPECRLQRRLAHVNQVHLYERTCDLTGASMISNQRPGSSYKVYRQEDWHSDAWDALSYGRDFDFSRPFFSQWQKLCIDVPRPSLFTGYEFDENCAYTNHSGKNKNCYLIFDSDENRDSYYSYSINKCVNCMDCFRTRKSELCYECIDSVQCYGSAYLQDCDNCSSSSFLKNCTGCRNCIMCSNLKNKEFFVENKPVSKEEFEKISAMLRTYSAFASARKRFEKLKLEFPQKYIHGIQNEDIVGDYLVRCKNAYMCFDSEDLWDCRYVYQAFMPLKNCMDIHECGDGELLYECSVIGYGVYNSLFCSHVLANVNDLIYCSLCPHSKHCFGCIGVRRKQYCIFNKQYTQEEYEALVPKIIEHMRKTEEWGEFLPIASSTYAYNETLAQDYYPLTKAEILAKGWSWFDEDNRNRYLGPAIVLPESIHDVRDEICKKILTCASSGRQYKIIPQELHFYRQLHLPLPRQCFFQRHKERIALRNLRKLWNRECMKCKTKIQTTYSPDQLETVYCEKCYLASIC